MQSLTYHADGRIAVLSLRQRDFAETGARPEESERLIDIPQMVGKIQVIVLATEADIQEDGRVVPLTRLSFRSKHAADDSAVNVADLAGRFGGGGHARAAGAKVDQPLGRVLERLADTFGDL